MPINTPDKGTEESETSWPTCNQIKRTGFGIALPGRVFTNISLTDLPYMVGDIMANVVHPNDCVKLQLVEVDSIGPQRLFNIIIEEIMRTDYPFPFFTQNYLKLYLESFCKENGVPGKPIDIFFESTGSFYEDIARGYPGC